MLDAGTGLRRLRAVFGGAPFAGTILLTHLHWDHVQGLPFFPPADRDDARVSCWRSPAQGDPVAVLAARCRRRTSRSGPTACAARGSTSAIEPGKHEFGGSTCWPRDVEHKGGRAFGYRVTVRRRAFAYVPDALDANDDAILDLAARRRPASSAAHRSSPPNPNGPTTTATAPWSTRSRSRSAPASAA